MRSVMPIKVSLNETIPFIKLSQYFKHNYNPGSMEGYIQKRVADAQEGTKNMGVMVKFIAIGMMVVMIVFALIIFTIVALPKLTAAAAVTVAPAAVAAVPVAAQVIGA